MFAVGKINQRELERLQEQVSNHLLLDVSSFLFAQRCCVGFTLVGRSSGSWGQGIVIQPSCLLSHLPLLVTSLMTNLSRS